METGNSETSLLSYLDALEGAFDDYVRRRPEAADLQRWFARNVYHSPFGGMALRAHKAVLRRSGVTDKRRAWEDFSKKTLPSLGYVRRMGATYGASTFLALMSLIESDPELCAGDRVGVFSYGSGSCAELWSGRVCPEAREVVAGARMTELLDARRQIGVAEYESIENARAAVIDSGDYQTDRSALGDLYATQYAGKGLLVFEGMGEYYRRYAWS